MEKSDMIGVSGTGSSKKPPAPLAAKFSGFKIQHLISGRQKIPRHLLEILEASKDGREVARLLRQGIICAAKRSG
jgi:hypothetical protein